MAGLADREGDAAREVADALRQACESHGFFYVVGHGAALLMEGVSLALGLDRDHFARTYIREPTVLFRISNYPAVAPDGGDWREGWGVGEHTDYGLLTLLAQDASGGLEVKTPGGWIQAPPIAGALVCNIGDMLERLTAGRFKSTPHRVLTRSGRDQLSFPLFYEPDFLAPMIALPAANLAGGQVRDDHDGRWDGASVHVFDGAYGDYLLGKVAEVFPQLAAASQLQD